MTSVDPIPFEVRNWLRRHAGSWRVTDACRAGSARTGVWRLDTDAGDVYLKLHRRRARWAGEVFAYRNWSHALEPYLPRLVGVYQDDTCQGVLLSALPGRPLRETSFRRGDAGRAYSRAGELLRRLHDSAVGPWFGSMDEQGRPLAHDGTSLAQGQQDPMEHLRGGLQELSGKAQRLGCLLPHECRCMEAALDQAECARGQVPVPSTSDYTPGNWLVDDAGELTAVIDLENALWGLRALAFSRLLMDYFVDDPEGEIAFYEGYGGQPSREQPELSRIGCVIYAAYYLTAGTESGNGGYVHRGRSAFTRMGQLSR